MKKIFLAGVLSLASLSIVSAKSYEIVLSATTKVGAVELKPGQYTLKVQGTNAIFTSVDTYKSYTTPVKVQNSDTKFDSTKVQSAKQGETDQIQEIDLGGSKTKLGF
jgi:hypothetical protein